MCVLQVGNGFDVMILILISPHRSYRPSTGCWYLFDCFESSEAVGMSDISDSYYSCITKNAWKSRAENRIHWKIVLQMSDFITDMASVATQLKNANVRKFRKWVATKKLRSSSTNLRGQKLHIPSKTKSHIIASNQLAAVVCNHRGNKWWEKTCLCTLCSWLFIGQFVHSNIKRFHWSRQSR